MVRANSDVLVPFGPEPVLKACVAASRTIPVVFVAINYDPIARGYVQSLRSPAATSPVSSCARRSWRESRSSC